MPESDYIDQLGNIAVKVAQAQGARVSLRVNAWPNEIQIADASDLKAGGGGSSLIKGQVIIRDAQGRVMQTIGPDVQTNPLLVGALVAGLAALLFIVVRGVSPRRRAS